MFSFLDSTTAPIAVAVIGLIIMCVVAYLNDKYWDFFHTVPLIICWFCTAVAVAATAILFSINGA